MTTAEAYRTLGVATNVSRKKAEAAYHERQKYLQLCLVPGRPMETRHRAMEELAKLNTAWETIQRKPRPRRYGAAQARPQVPRPRPRQVQSPGVPQTLGEAWEQVVCLLPFSKPVNSWVLILLLLLVLLSVIVRLGK